MRFPEQVKTLVAERPLTGTLPASRPTVSAPGLGAGHAHCAACDDRIEMNDVECVCDVAQLPPLDFPIDCFTEWRRQQQPD